MAIDVNIDSGNWKQFQLDFHGKFFNFFMIGNNSPDNSIYDRTVRLHDVIGKAVGISAVKMVYA